jgi:hypothetical protein
MTADPYFILGIKRGVTKAELKEAYRALALRFHPDKNKSPGAEEHFKTILAAYDELLPITPDEPIAPSSPPKPAVTYTSESPAATESEIQICPLCQGNGWDFNWIYVCASCGGDGIVNRTRGKQDPWLSRDEPISRDGRFSKKSAAPSEPKGRKGPLQDIFQNMSGSIYKDVFEGDL